MTYVGVAAAVVSAIGSLAQGRAQAKQAAFQASIAQQQAERATQQAKLDEIKYRRKVSADLAKARARFGASGIDPSSGSALLSIEDGAGIGELDSLTVRSQGLARAHQFENQATLSLMDASATKQSAFFSAGTKLLHAADLYQGIKKREG